MNGEVESPWSSLFDSSCCPVNIWWRRWELEMEMSFRKICLLWFKSVGCYNSEGLCCQLQCILKRKIFNLNVWILSQYYIHLHRIIISNVHSFAYKNISTSISAHFAYVNYTPVAQSGYRIRRACENFNLMQKSDWIHFNRHVQKRRALLCTFWNYFWQHKAMPWYRFSE